MHVYFRELFVPHNAKKQTFAIVLHKKEDLKKKREGPFALPAGRPVGNQREKTLESLVTAENWNVSSA